MQRIEILDQQSFISGQIIYHRKRGTLRGLLRMQPTIPFTSIAMSSSAIELDIANYIRASTRARITEELLILQDPALEELIVQELVKGAK